MDPFSYLSVLLSIILGLGIAQLLTGVGRLIQIRGRVREYWPSYVWVAVLLVAHVQTWWAMFGLRAVTTWSFIAFFIVLMQPTVLYLQAALVLPDTSTEGMIDLRANYFGNVRWFFGFAIALLFVSLVKDLVISGHLPNTLNLSAHLLFIALWSAGALVHSERWHKVLALLTATMMLLYIAILFAQLR